MQIREVRTDTTIEKQILTSFIVSDDILTQFADLTKPEYFESSYIRTIIIWILDYFQRHESAPRTYIQQIYDYKVADGQIDETDAQLIEQLLIELSTNFEVQNEVNVNYHSEIVEEFFKRRELQLTTSHVRGLLDDNRTADAEMVMLNYRKVARRLATDIDPFDPEEVHETFSEKFSEFFKLPGALGRFLGDFDRGWLIGLSGPFKRGKTWYAQEFAVQGILNELRVAFFSLEMQKGQMKERIYKRLTVTGKESKIYRFPIFDCKYNQIDDCLRPERVGNGGIYAEGEVWRLVPPSFSDHREHVPCTACRDDRDLRDNYFPAVWYETRKRPQFGERRIAFKIRQLQMYLGRLRLKCYPRFSANINDIRRDLEVMENVHDFVPDIIIIDYADILRPEDKVEEGFQKEDRTWIALSQLAMERNALVITPTQVTKAGQDVRQQSAKHQARWVGKLGHVDAMLALNQTEEEQKAGIMRISKLAHRHDDFHPSHNCIVLQNLDVGQSHLDSEIERYENDDGELD